MRLNILSPFSLSAIRGRPKETLMFLFDASIHDDPESGLLCSGSSFRVADPFLHPGH